MPSLQRAVKLASCAAGWSWPAGSWDDLDSASEVSCVALKAVELSFALMVVVMMVDVLVSSVSSEGKWLVRNWYVK